MTLTGRLRPFFSFLVYLFLDKAIPCRDFLLSSLEVANTFLGSIPATCLGQVTLHPTRLPPRLVIPPDLLGGGIKSVPCKNRLKTMQGTKRFA